MFDVNCKMFEFTLCSFYTSRARGATVARLTPDQKVACSNHVRVKILYSYIRLTVFKV